MNVVLVEDNPDHAAMLIEIFDESLSDSSLQHAWDGEAAIRLLTEIEGDVKRGACHRPDLILLDLRLPRIDGIEVLRRIRNQEMIGLVPVVVLTTSAAERDIQAAYKHCANSYLVKPVEYQAFERMMDSLGFYWGQCNRSPT